LARSWPMLQVFSFHCDRGNCSTKYATYMTVVEIRKYSFDWCHVCRSRVSPWHLGLRSKSSELLKRSMSRHGLVARRSRLVPGGLPSTRGTTKGRYIFLGYHSGAKENDIEIYGNVVQVEMWQTTGYNERTIYMLHEAAQNYNTSSIRIFCAR